MGSDDVRLVNTAVTAPGRSAAWRFEVPRGSGSKGVAVSADGKRLYVHASFKHQLLVTELPTPERFNVPKFATLALGEEKWPAAAVHGRELFYSARDSRVSAAGQFACGSCHPEGREDGMVWRLDKGPRQTPVLAGRLVGTAPFNWLGTRGTLQDNMKDTMGRLGGSGLPKKDLADLEVFITRYLDPGPSHAPEAMGALAARGKQLFESADVGCAHCHAGTQFTDGKNHDVGTTTHEEVARMLSERGLPQEEQPTNAVARFFANAATATGTTQLLRALGGRPLETRTPIGVLAVSAFAAMAMMPQLGTVAPIRTTARPLQIAQIGFQRPPRRFFGKPRPRSAFELLAQREAKAKKDDPLRLAYNTPSLVGVAGTGPYFHDGSARTLRDVLTTGNPGDRMGRTSQLSPADVDALVAYLDTL
jgi:cytochrome c peroxidase